MIWWTSAISFQFVILNWCGSPVLWTQTFHSISALFLPQLATHPSTLLQTTDIFPPVISKLGKKLQLRQRVIATATVFFRRFYLKNSYCETDPYIVISACCYLAAKAEESPVHIKNVVSEARTLFSRESSS